MKMTPTFWSEYYITITSFHSSIHPSTNGATAPSDPWTPSEDASLHSSLSSARLLHLLFLMSEIHSSLFLAKNVSPYHFEVILYNNSE